VLLEAYNPRSCLEVKRTQVPVPKFPAIDMHTHFGNLLAWASKIKAVYIFGRMILVSAVSIMRQLSSRSCGLFRPYR